MISGIIAGATALGGSIFSAIKSKRDRKRAEKSQRQAEQRQLEINRQIANEDEQRRRQALLDDASLQKQGYKNAGMSTASLTPSANTVGATAAVDTRSSFTPSESPMSVGLQAYQQAQLTAQNLELGAEQVKSMKLDNENKEKDLEDKEGFFNAVRSIFGNEYTPSSLQALTMDLQLKRDSLAFKGAQRLFKNTESIEAFNEAMAKWRLEHKEFYDIFNGMPEQMKQKISLEIAGMRNENQFKAWYNDFQKTVSNLDYFIKKQEAKIRRESHNMNINLQAQSYQFNRETHGMDMAHNKKMYKAQEDLSDLETYYDMRDWLNSDQSKDGGYFKHHMRGIKIGFRSLFDTMQSATNVGSSLVKLGK